MIKLLELFGGIGAPRVALRNIGVPVKSLDYVEIDQQAVRSYNAMFEKDLAYKPQSVVGWNYQPDILIHGSPCQDFSIAGHQRGGEEGSETRSSLMWETIRIVQNMGAWRPRYIVWENVPNVTSRYMRPNFERYIRELKDLGYTSSWDCLNAMDFGLPQLRKRVIVVSWQKGTEFPFDKLTHRPMADIHGFLETNVPDRYTVCQPSLLAMIGRKGISRLDVIDKFCYTIRTRQDQAPNAGVVPLPDGKYRFLTERECWRLNGYWDSDFAAAERANPVAKDRMNRALYRQSGNTIAVPMLESLFQMLLLEEGDGS